MTPLTKATILSAGGAHVGSTFFLGKIVFIPFIAHVSNTGDKSFCCKKKRNIQDQAEGAVL